MHRHVKIPEIRIKGNNQMTKEINVRRKSHGKHPVTGETLWTNKLYLVHKSEWIATKKTTKQAAINMGS